MNKLKIFLETTCAAIYEESNCSSEISAISNLSQGSLPQSVSTNFANIKCIKVTQIAKSFVNIYLIG